MLDSTKKLLALTLLIAFLVKLVMILTVTDPNILYKSGGDDLVYNSIAVNIVEGNGFKAEGEPVPLMRIAPAYPLFLAINYFIFGHNYYVIRVIQALLLILTSISLYFIGKLIFNKRIGLFSAILVAFYPQFTYYNLMLLTESLYIFLLSIAMLLIVLALVEDRLKLYIFAGLALGIANLCRPITTLFPFFILIGLLFVYERKIRAIKNFTVLVVFMLVAMCPWVIRNYIVSGKFLLTSSAGGYHLYYDNYLPGVGKGRTVEDVLRDVEDPEINKKLLQKGFRLIANNLKTQPLKYLKLVLIEKPMELWITTQSGIYGITKSFSFYWRNGKYGLFLTKLASMCFYLGLLLLALIGFVFSIKKWRKIMPIFLIIIYFTVVHMLLLPEHRYGVPVIPYVLIFSINGILLLYAKFTKKEMFNSFNLLGKDSYEIRN